jgi:hypothetical protein
MGKPFWLNRARRTRTYVPDSCGAHPGSGPGAARPPVPLAGLPRLRPVGGAEGRGGGLTMTHEAIRGEEVGREVARLIVTWHEDPWAYRALLAAPVEAAPLVNELHAIANHGVAVWESLRRAYDGEVIRLLAEARPLAAESSPTWPGRPGESTGPRPERTTPRGTLAGALPPGRARAAQPAAISRGGASGSARIPARFDRVGNTRLPTRSRRYAAPRDLVGSALGRAGRAPGMEGAPGPVCGSGPRRWTSVSGACTDLAGQALRQRP